MSARILIIEDNFQNRYLFKLLLEKNGHEVLEASNGRLGLLMAAETRPQLILLDIQLPDIDGYQVAEQLSTDTQHRNTPVVAVTSYAMAGDRDKALAAGCSGYIEKPINPETFIREVEAYLKKTPSRKAQP